MPSTPIDHLSLVKVLAAFNVLVLFYGLFIIQQPLLAFNIVLLSFTIYLAWRFVRAHERIAAALEE